MGKDRIKENLEPRKFSYFRAPISNCYPSHEVDLATFLDEVRSDKHKEEVEMIRSEPDEEKQNSLKRTLLPFVTFGGTFSYRAKAKLERPSGLLCADVDHIDQGGLASLREKVTGDPYTLAIFESPRAGLKIVVRIPIVTGPEEYSRRFVAYSNYLKKQGIPVGNIDKATKDLSRACFVSHDPGAFYNPNPTPFTAIESEAPLPSVESRQTAGEKDTSRSAREFGEVCRLIKEGKTKEEVYEEMQAFSKWSTAPAQYREITYKKALTKTQEDPHLPPPKTEKKEDFYKYPTRHLPHYESLRELTMLQGEEYTPILKALWHNLMGVITRDHKIQQGGIYTDGRAPLKVVVTSGGGKKNIKQTASSVLEPLGYDVHSPLSMHSQQLIGKVVNRGTPTKPRWVKIEGYLSRDYVIIDEGYELMTSKDQDLKESRRAVRIAKDPIGHNKVEKKMVDNTFNEDEKISYFPKASFLEFTQPKKFPPEVVEDGDLRRDMVAYVRGLAGRDKDSEYKSKWTDRCDTETQKKQFSGFLNAVAANIAGKEFSFTEEGIQRGIKLHKCVVTEGFIHSEKGANFSKMADYTLIDWLVKLSMHIAAAYDRTEITAEIVELAFLDLMEMFKMQLDFIQDKVEGTLDYGDKWGGAVEKDQVCLEWLHNHKDTTISDFQIAIRELKGVGEDMAAKHYSRMKRKGWIDSKQEGQHGSRVWLTFKPMYVGPKLVIQGSKGSKGCNAYKSIFGGLDAKISSLGTLPPLQPLLPSDIPEEVIQ